MPTQHMSQLKVRKNHDDSIVEVNTGDGWRGLAPDAAREMATGYEQSVQSGEMEDSSGVRRFIRLLRQYANDVERP